MPIKLNDAQINILIEKMKEVYDTMEYGVYGKVFPGQKKELEKSGKEGFCNCWQAVLLAAKKANLGYTDDDIKASITKTQIGDVAISVYVFKERRFVMFPDESRGKLGIPAGLAQPGDLIMWGPGAHIALAVGGEIAYEFEKTKDRRGRKTINEIDILYRTYPVMCAPLPEPGELKQVVFTNATRDLSKFTDLQIAQLEKL
ncbi:MAG TPA: hypothetical protein VE993_10650 [Stellaceae bacterium]|nr:hypothetical protein [Stellaceae bacterium]